MVPPNNEIAALVGNGLSIAFNPELALPRINEALKTRLNVNVTSGELPATILQKMASRVDTGDPAQDFEALLGPLDQYRDGIRMLGQFAEVVGGDDPDLLKALKRSESFAKDVRRFGVGHALEVIAHRSKAKLHLKGNVDAFIKAMVDAAGGSRLTIGNLNYDCLGMASLVEHYQRSFCDMSDGRMPSVQKVFKDMEGGLLGRPLRLSANFPNDRRIRLLHLHGSLTWLRSPEGVVFRFEIGDLRDYNYWQDWREGNTDWQPQVVLTNQATKSEVVKQPPFAMGYEVFEKSLVASDRWLIAGYSFRDGCVNEMLARAWLARTRKPSIMVITHGDELTQGEILRVLGHTPVVDPDPAKFIQIERAGIVAATTSFPWFVWSLASNAA